MARRAGGGGPATCCCSRRMLWLALFFVIPFYSLVATSLFDPAGSDFRGYEMT